MRCLNLVMEMEGNDGQLTVLKCVLFELGVWI